MDESSISIRVEARPERLSELREVVKVHATRFEFGEPCVMDLMLAVDEACMNIIQHGYRGEAGDIELTIAGVTGGMEIRLYDTAPPVTLDSWKSRDLDDIRPGGLGVHFIREIMDEIAYIQQPGGAGNCLRLVKYRKKCRTE